MNKEVDYTNWEPGVVPSYGTEFAVVMNDVDTKWRMELKTHRLQYALCQRTYMCSPICLLCSFEIASCR